MKKDGARTGLDWLLGERLATYEEENQQIGVLAGIPVLGLDALSSAAYGPEAALTLLLPLGALGLHYVGPISALIVGILLIVYFSYRQTPICVVPTASVPPSRAPPDIKACCRCWCTPSSEMACSFT